MKRCLFMLRLLISNATVWANESALDISELNSEIDIKHFIDEVNIAPTIVGPDDREDITPENVKDSEKAIVLMVTMSSEGDLSTCSGAMVGPNVVLTAAHCFVNNRGEYNKDAEVIAVIAKNPPDSDEADLPVSAVSTKLHASAKYIEYCQTNMSKRASAPYDYGVITLDKPIGLTTGWFKLRAIPMSQLQSSSIRIIGLSYDKGLDTLWKAEGSVDAKRITNDNTFAHNADMLPGASGSPVVLKDRPNEIVGINVGELGGYHVEEGFPNLGVIITQDIVDFVNKQNIKSLLKHKK